MNRNRSSYEADLFFADLMGWPARSRRRRRPLRRAAWAEHVAAPQVAQYLVGSGRWGRGFVSRGAAYPGRIHAAQDVPGPRGTEVYAALDGTVIHARPRRGYGNLVILRHQAEDVTTAYAHLDSLRVQEGEAVRGGQVIGTMGNTTEGPAGDRGRVRAGMGVHVHFSIQRVPAGWSDERIASAFSSRYEERRDIRVEPRPWLEQKGIALAREPFVPERRRGGAQQETWEQVAPACPLPKGSACAYFFKGADYLRYNIPADRVDAGPAAIARFWRLPASFQSDLRASVNWGDGHAYFFKGASYVRYNIATDRVDVGPVAISRFWTALPAEFQSDIDAAVNWGNGFAYFFKRNRYLRYDIARNVVDVGPTEISRQWTRLPAAFQSDLDSVVNWGDGNVYFFKGDRYLRCRAADDVVEVGPTEISRNWTALPATFHRDVRAAINWTFPIDLAALMRAAGVTVTESADWRTRRSSVQGGCFTPVGVMMHHTVGVGPNALADIVTNIKANFFVDRAGTLNVVSGGRANHAGKGAREVLEEVDRGVAPTGTAAARGLRDSLSGNGHFYGFENENRGDGVQPWPEVQLDAMARGAAALCQLHGWNENRVISHAEWTRRKIDPRGIDMNDFRARVRTHF